ncbi:serine/threonine-protein kinase ATR-like isoform X2 [Tachypleus tridentatus]|uniref:serine/threonine-protein kinase ATR-like isoform X2 n=1 Tax=Tachypleus tridentatus TaxID=6853 RepID=UPI003FD387ED
MLTDMEKAAQVFTGLCPSFQRSYSSVSGLNIDKLLEEWRGRRKLVQSSLRYQEPLLNLYRVLLTIAKNHIPEQTKKIDYEIVTCWLQSAKLARKSGHQQRAYSCLLEASVLNIPETFVEKSKWHWNKNEQEQAINILQKGIQEHFPDVSQFKNNPSQKQKEAAACAKATLMLAKYSEESAVLESNALILMYRDVVAIQPEWEEGHFHLAKYYDRVMTTLEKSEKKSEVIVHMVQCYGRSLQYGCRHLFHSMPRMLSLWFDLGTQVVEHQKSKKPPQYLEQWERMLNVMTTKVIPNFVEKLPPYLFYTAFSQLISRICHSHPGISLQLQDIIARLLVSYSQQVMWMIMTVSKSSYQMRRQRCLEIFNKANKVKPELSKFINDATCLADQLLDLCNKKVETIKPLSINQHMRSLPRLITERDFSQILLPVQSVMTVTLPSKMGSECGHNPFPQTPVYIQGFEDTIEILPSLQRPKKITIRGSDGNKYPMMCKPKDDLRKDCRLMEFTNLVNKCLKEDPEARKRQLYIRTYAVIPLNEECGLVEWVSNLNGLRQILNKIYKEKGLFTSGRELQSMAPANGAPLETKMEAYKKNFLPHFPPVFSEWFLTTFLDPTAWYLARLAYCRTTAVMSMVGYVLGLGDRHGENLLMDSSCGDTVHVDFNCLFNKGETFDCPERVPFRLTHNMVEAMGPLGYEGIFRKACEVTMKVMRNQKEALMSVLKPFVYDPLVEWSKSTKSLRSVSLDSGEINNEKALIHVRDIEQRLKGVVRSKLKGQGLPLSIEGQVNYLIQEATDEKLLCQMYVGWAAYM